MSTGRGIIKNIFSLTAAEIVSKLLNVIAIVYLGRILGPDGFGKLGFVQSLVSYFIVFAVTGYHVYGIREVAKNRDNIHNCVIQIFYIKFASSVVLIFFFTIFTFIIPQPETIRLLMLLMSLSIFTNGLTLEWVFNGMEKMEWVAIGTFIRSVAYLALLVTLVKSADDLLYVAFSIVGSEWIAVFFFYVMYRKQIGNISVSPISVEWKRIFISALPMSLSALTSQIYTMQDIIFLGLWTTSTITGWYTSAFKVIFMIQGIGYLLSNALFPTVSRLFKDAPDRAERLLTLTGRLLISLGLPIAVGGTILSKDIILLLFGVDFIGASLAFEILIWSCFTAFSGIIYTLSLLANDKQGYHFIAMLIGVIINVTLNIFLIPRYGLVGAAVAKIISEVVVLSIFYFFGRKFILFPFYVFLYKPLFASIIMGLLIMVIDLDIFIKMMIGIVVYIVILFITKGIKISDYMLIWDALKNR